MEERRELIYNHIIEILKKSECLEDAKLEAENNGWHIDDMTGSLNTLAANEKILLEKYEIQKDQLTPEALISIENGSPEYRLWVLAGEENFLKKNLVDKLGKEAAQSGFAACMSKKWIKHDKQSDIITRTIDQAVDEMKDILQRYQKGERIEKEVQELKKRKFLKQA